MHFGVFEGVRTMNDPDMALGIHRHADGGAHHPVIGQRLGPHRVHFKPGRHHRGGVENGRAGKQNERECG